MRHKEVSEAQESADEGYQPNRGIKLGVPSNQDGDDSDPEIPLHDHESSDQDENEREDEVNSSRADDQRGDSDRTHRGRKGGIDSDTDTIPSTDSRSSTPRDQFSRKRKVADDSLTDSESDGKRAKQNSSQPSNSRPKVSDYPRDVQAILYHAISIHHSRIASEAPFPDADLEGQIAEEAFQLACRAKKKRYTSDADLIKVICKSTSQMRGELKTIARYMVELFFGFHDRLSKTRANKRRYKDLTADYAFLYEDPDKLKAMWCSPVLFKLIKKMFFKKKNDDGIHNSEYFNPIKPPTIALAYAAVRCALDEWSEGIFDPVDFTTATYKDVYDELRQGLTELAKDPEGERELTNLGQELWEESR
ncbi:hypothetical protein BOTBODRAFT_258369 [Botryobasidium botryosum FD-172 SS1]|uniref:DUF6532 domain-containing protein n=1 Tax=Botryobasidium botryosum (strain FD-172 SS1) TaxID=930990 RepID=A0A067MWL5_BOTB1|nr:hypothetical protein BOTBODRAFT_258369 [Botryobasidium botryosum FD-172 SS1]